jgi:hypothetical protein
MSSVIISGDTSGAITLSAPAVAGTNTITLPAATGTMVVAGQNSAITAGTAVATTSGTSATFTSIPSWVKRITVMLNAISFSAAGGGGLGVRIGTGGTLTTTGYVTRYFGIDGTGTAFNSVGATNAIAGNFNANGQLQTAANTLSGVATITNITGNIWTSTFTLYNGQLTDVIVQGGGYITLAGTLDIVGITLLAGTAFDAGSINILYE